MQMYESVCVMSYGYTVSTVWTETYTVANRVEPDETAPNEPFHLLLHCLPFCLQFLSDTSICNNRYAQNQI